MCASLAFVVATAPVAFGEPPSVATVDADLPSPVLNASLLARVRRLTASPGCLKCCGAGNCSVAFNNAYVGMCCGNLERPYCCPATATCSTVFGKCERPKKTKHRTVEKIGMQRPASRSSNSSGINSLLTLLTFIAVGVACCMWMSPRPVHQKDDSVVQGHPVGSGPGGTVYGHTMGGTGGAYPHMNSGGGFGGAALAGGAGLVGGMMLGSMMSGPSWGHGNYYGGGYGGYGGEPYVTEMTETTGGDVFMGDGGMDLGGGGGAEFGGGDFGGDF